jgi:hypothetical protein
MQKSLVKIILTAFFVVVKLSFIMKFCRQKQTVNGRICKEMIKRLIARVHCVGPEFQESGSWYLLRDNAPTHSLGVVSEFLAKRWVPVLSHPPYSVILSLLSFLFSKLKIATKGTRFEAVSSIQQTVTRELKAIREEAVSRSFDSLYERCNRCAESGGAYIE